jgi:hypothetical protein
MILSSKYLVVRASIASWTVEEAHLESLLRDQVTRELVKAHIVCSCVAWWIAWRRSLSERNSLLGLSLIVSGEEYSLPTIWKVRTTEHR